MSGALRSREACAGSTSLRQSAAWITFAIIMAAHPSAAMGQTTPLAPPTREEVERVPVRPLPDRGARLEVEGGVAAGPCALDDARFEDIRVTLSAVEFEALGPVSPDLLHDAYAGLLGSEQPISVLCAIRDRATAILNDAGYLAVVEIPEQRLGDGRARVGVVLGRCAGSPRTRSSIAPPRNAICSSPAICPAMTCACRCGRRARDRASSPARSPSCALARPSSPMSRITARRRSVHSAAW